MKKLIFVLSILFTMNLFAQDVIIKRDGSTIISKVTEVKDSEVKYKKYNNLNGPVYSIAMSEINQINYENGEKESFSVNKTFSTSELMELDYKYNHIEIKINKLKRTALFAGGGLAIAGLTCIYAAAEGTGTDTELVAIGGALLIGGGTVATSTL